MNHPRPHPTAAAFPPQSWVSAAWCGPNGGNCVEVNLGVASVIGLRDSKRPAGPVLVFDAPAWRHFLAGACHGHFDTRPDRHVKRPDHGRDRDGDRAVNERAGR